MNYYKLLISIFQRYKRIIKGLKDFVFENYYRQIGFPKDTSYHSVQLFKCFVLLATKLIEKNT